MQPNFQTYKYQYSNFNQNDGQITDIIVTGGTGTHLVTWEGPSGYSAGPFSGFTSSDLTNLIPGSYSGTVVDSVSSASTVVVDILEKNPIVVEFTGVTLSNGCDNIINVNSVVGNGFPYILNLIDDDSSNIIGVASGTTENEMFSFTGLCVGDYTIEARETQTVEYTFNVVDGCVTKDVVFDNTTDPSTIISNWDRYAFFSDGGLSGMSSGIQSDGTIPTDDPTKFFYTGVTNDRYKGVHALVNSEGEQPNVPFFDIDYDFYYDSNINKFLVKNNLGIGPTWNTFAPREDYGVNGSPRTNINVINNNWSTTNVTNSWYTIDSNNTVKPAATKINDEGGFTTAIHGLSNAQQRSGLFSDCAFNNYVHEFTIGSGNSDDDNIGVVLASFRDGDNLFGDSGYTYGLYFDFDNQIAVGQPSVRVSYNMDTDKGFLLDNGNHTNVFIRKIGTSVTPYNVGGYANQGYVRVRVTRSGIYGENFRIQMTDTMGDKNSIHPLATKNINETNPYNPNYEINFSLLNKNTWGIVSGQTSVSDTELQKFLSSQRYGYLARSQPDARIFDLAFSGSQNNLLTSFISSDSGVTYEFQTSLGTDSCECFDITSAPITSFLISSDGFITGINKTGSTPTVMILDEDCCTSLNGTWSSEDMSCILNRDASITEQRYCDRLFDYKIILNPEDNSGAIFDVDSGETCSLTIGFDYLLQWDCSDLLNCIEEYNTTASTQVTIIDVLSAATLTATIEKHNIGNTGSSLETVYETTVLEVNNFLSHITGNTGYLVSGDNSTDCELLESELTSALSVNCNLLSGNTILNSEWVTFSENITNQTVLEEIKNERISIGLKVHSEICEFNLLIDRIKMTQDCLKIVNNEKVITKSPGFELSKVVDNKKSWIPNSSFETRNYDLEYRNTCYDVNNGKLVINSKELGIETSVASAIEEAVNSLIFTGSCFTEINESFTRDTNVYAFFDTTSMLIGDAIAAWNSLQVWFTNFQNENPSYQGNLYGVPTPRETYLEYPYRLSNGTLSTIVNNSSTWLPVNTLPSTFSGDTDVILLAFVDETNTEYHSARLDNGYLLDNYSITPDNNRVFNINLSSFTLLPPNREVVSVTNINTSMVQIVSNSGTTVIYNTISNPNIVMTPTGPTSVIRTTFQVVASEIDNPTNTQTINFNVNFYDVATNLGLTQPSTRFVYDYNNFLSVYNDFNFFKGIVYPIVRDGNSGYGASLALQVLSAIEGRVLSPSELNQIDTSSLNLSAITVTNPYTNYPLGSTFMEPLKNFNWRGVYNKTSPAINVFNSDVFKNDLDSLLKGGFTIDIIDLLGDDLNQCNISEQKTNIVRNKLIDVKSRKVISSYPVLQLIYERYYNYLLFCGVPSNQLTYEVVINFTKLLGNQWVDLIEQFVPSTALWKSTNIYSNTIYDSNKFKYRNYSTEACSAPTSNDTTSHTFAEGGVEIFDLSDSLTIIDETCQTINNSTLCNTIYGFSINDNSIFRGNITISDLNGDSNNTTVINEVIYA